MLKGTVVQNIRIFTATINSEKWILFLLYMGRRSVGIRVRVIHPSVNSGWISAAVSDDIVVEYNLFAFEKTDTLNFAEYGGVVKVQIKSENLKRYQIFLHVKI